MATQLHVHPAQMRFGGIAAAPDRTRAFRAARRHSVLVGLFKLLLPLSALGIAALYILPPQITIKPRGGGEVTIEQVKPTLSGGLRMVNPRYQGVHEKYGTYDIRADSSLQKVGQPEI